MATHFCDGARAFLPVATAGAFQHTRASGQEFSRSLPSPTDLGALEGDTHAIDAFDADLNFEALGVDRLRDFLAVDINNGVEATLGKDIDEHSKSIGVFEDGALRVDHRAPVVAEGVSPI